MTDDVELVFMCLFALCYVDGEVSLHIFRLFFKVGFLLLINELCILDTSPLSSVIL